MSHCTGGRREQVDHALHGTAIEQDFTVVVSADDITAGKFDPALYQAILTRMTASDYTIGLGKSAI